MKSKSIRIKIFLTLVAVILTIVAFLIVANNFILETFYLYSKQKVLIDTYEKINEYYNHTSENFNIELEKIASNNGFDIVIETDTDTNIYTSTKNFLLNINIITDMENAFPIPAALQKEGEIQFKRIKDNQTGLSFNLLSAKLDNGYKLYIRMPISSIHENVRIFNHFIYIIGSITILLGGFVVLIITKKITTPIVELNGITKKMAVLDFSKKYRINDSNDEINELGRNINIVSDKLEKTIAELKETNIELEKDIEKKSKIDEMRTQFISDVSHELKTPISLIQGYAEGLVENVIQDEEAKKMYAGVILDEANKMDSLVKQLLELMKLEYGHRMFNNKNFDICELIKEVIRKSKVIYEEKGITVILETEKPCMVYADDFYIEQILNNYFINAIKYLEERNSKKEIRISIEEKESKKRISVYNTGKNIDKADVIRIWNRFYKCDTSRNREEGGSGIGLALVKAIMNNYGNEYGMINKEQGVEFYFELDKEEQKEESFS